MMSNPPAWLEIVFACMVILLLPFLFAVFIRGWYWFYWHCSTPFLWIATIYLRLVTRALQWAINEREQS